jgi:hypothetical protein
MRQNMDYIAAWKPFKITPEIREKLMKSTRDVKALYLHCLHGRKITRPAQAAASSDFIARTFCGQAFTQMPQAIHLLGAGAFFAWTITLKGQASTHFPQFLHFALFIM